MRHFTSNISTCNGIFILATLKVTEFYYSLACDVLCAGLMKGEEYECIIIPTLAIALEAETTRHALFTANTHKSVQR